MENIFDPCRKKLVPLTPEEKVRQWMVGVLGTRAGIPLTLIGTEVPFKMGSKDYRADIVVYESGTLTPKLIVECKREDVPLTKAVLEQAMRYNLLLKVPFLVITNGAKSFCFQAAEGQIRQISFDDLVKNL